MLNHHSLNLLIHLSVLALLGGEYLVNASKNTISMEYFAGKNIIRRAETNRPIANLSLAWYNHENSETLVHVKKFGTNNGCQN